MLLSPEQIQIEALSLPPEQRAELAERLLESLGGEQNGDVTHEWLQLATKRLKEIRSGETTLIDGDTVLANARKSLSQ